MILYLDTSALVKLYIEERGSEQVHAWVDEAEFICTSRVALPEAMSAFQRRFNRGELPPEAFAALSP